MLKKLSSITPKTLEVFYFFASNPLNRVHGREVARQTGVSLGAVHQALKKLYRLGLLIREEKGRMYFYGLNTKSAVARQFKVLLSIFALDDLVYQIREDSERIVLFGSCAEGTDVENSDIDLFVLTPNVETVQREISQYEERLDKRISPIVVDSSGLAKLKSKDKPLYERISRGITLWERE